MTDKSHFASDQQPDGAPRNMMAALAEKLAPEAIHGHLLLQLDGAANASYARHCSASKLTQEDYNAAVQAAVDDYNDPERIEAWRNGAGLGWCRLVHIADLAAALLLKRRHEIGGPA